MSLTDKKYGGGETILNLEIVKNQRDSLWYGHTDKVTVTLPLNAQNSELIRFNNIDEIKNYPDVKSICIAGLKQNDFNYFIERYGRQFEAIHFWKCPLTGDLTPMEYLTDVRYITYYWNQRAVRLWDLSQNRCLKGLIFDDFTRMHSLEDIALSQTLEELEFGNLIWDKYILESLEPLSKSGALRHLAFSAKKIADGDPFPLTQIKKLRSLYFPSNLFTTEQVAMLTVRLEHVESNSLAPYYRYATEESPDGKDTIITGKGKPRLSFVKDAARIAKYKKEFEEMVERYRREKE